MTALGAPPVISTMPSGKQIFAPHWHSNNRKMSDGILLAVIFYGAEYNDVLIVEVFGVFDRA